MSTKATVLTEDERFIGVCNKVRFYPMTAVSASGSVMVDSTGREFLDFTASWAVANTGYGHPRVVEAIRSAAETLSFTSLSTIAHPAATELAARLLELTPGRQPRKVSFGLSGSDAVEGMAKLVPISRGRPKLIAFLGGMHGMTASSAGVSGHPALASFPGSTHVTRVPYPNPYRPAFGDAKSCGREAVRFIEEQILTTVSPPELTAGILVEPIQSDGGVVVPPDDFLPALRRLCDKYGLWLIADEVKVGMGRTGRLWASQLTATEPDVLIAGKALGSGMPISAAIAPSVALDAMIAGHAFTTAGSPVPCQAALATLAVLEDEGLIANAAVKGDRLLAGLREIERRHALIGEVRGRGLILGVELVKDRVTKEPARRECAKLAYRCWELGLLIHYVGSFSNVVEITPPLVITDEQVDVGLALFEKALMDVESDLVSDETIAAYAGW